MRSRLLAFSKACWSFDFHCVGSDFDWNLVRAWNFFYRLKFIDRSGCSMPINENSIPTLRAFSFNGNCGWQSISSMSCSVTPRNRATSRQCRPRLSLTSRKTVKINFYSIENHHENFFNFFPLFSKKPWASFLVMRNFDLSIPSPRLQMFPFLSTSQNISVTFAQKSVYKFYYQRKSQHGLFTVISSLREMPDIGLNKRVFAYCDSETSIFIYQPLQYL